VDQLEERLRESEAECAVLKREVEFLKRENRAAMVWKEVYDAREEEWMELGERLSERESQLVQTRRELRKVYHEQAREIEARAGPSITEDNGDTNNNNNRGRKGIRGRGIGREGNWARRGKK